jgi:DNA polymerase I
LTKKFKSLILYKLSYNACVYRDCCITYNFNGVVVTSKYLVFDTESSKLPAIDPWHPSWFICSLGLELEDGTSKTWLFNHESEPIRPHEEMLKEIQEYFDSVDTIVGHNIKYDLNILRKLGIKFDDKRIHCTMIADYLLHGQNTAISYKLNACAKREHLGQKVDKMAEYWDNGYETDQIPWELHDTYLRQDVNLTHQLYKIQTKQIEAAGITKIAVASMELSKMLSEMESKGVPFDKDGALEYLKSYDQRLEGIDARIFEIAGGKFKITSANELRAYMFGGEVVREVPELIAKGRKDGTYRVYTRKSKLTQQVKGFGFTPDESTKSAKTGEFSVSKRAQLWLRWETPEQEEVLRLLAERSNAQKVYSTLISKDPKKDSGLLSKIGSDGRIHPGFNQTRTRTGRLSSSNPNAQNLPRGNTSPLKKLFYSKNGFIINADLSQIEWRTAAALSGDQIMIDEINHGFDVHTYAAHTHFNAPADESTKAFKAVRTTAKIYNFRMIYNGKAKAFYFDPSMPRFDLPKWKKVVDAFWVKYATLRKWHYHNEALVNSQHFLRNPSGRILTFKYNRDENEGPKGYSLNAICNYPVQSISADLMFLAMLTIYSRMKAKGLKSDILLQVHDSLVIDAYPEEVYQVGAICLDVFESLPALSREYYGWDIPTNLTGEIGLGKNYGTLVQEYKSVTYAGKPSEAFTKENVDLFLTENS